MQLATSTFPLAVARAYQTALAVDGPLGIGWSLNLKSHLFYAVYLYAAPSTYQKEADIVNPNGVRYRFVENSDGSYTPPISRHDTLTKNVDGSFDLAIADGSTKYHYAPNGNLATVSDEFGNQLQFTYDASDRLQQVSDPLSGRNLNLYYGPDGRISTISDNTGRQVQYSYNQAGALTSVIDPAAHTTSYTYTTVRGTPQLTGITDNWGRTVAGVTYDSQGRTATYTENGETYTYTYNYNSNSNQSSKVDSSGNRWIYTYTSDGPITERDYPGGTSVHTVFNSDRSIQMVTDEVGVKTSYAYTAIGRVASVTKDFGGALAVRFDYTYDPSFPSKVISIIPKNPSTGAYNANWQGWKYDYYQAADPAPGALFHVYRLRSDGVTADTIATYTYDTHGRVLTVTDAAAALTTYTYDAVGNLATVTAPSNNDAGTHPLTSYGYDPLGRVTSVTDPLSKTTSYTYDALDRITSVALPPPVAGSNLNFTTTYSYDNYDSAAALTFTNVTDPNSVITKQGYDQFGRLRRSIDGLGNATSYAYFNDVLSGITDANNNTTSYTYDGQKRLIATTFPDNAQETYTYYADGLLHTKTDRKNQTITYTYDDLKRLVTKSYPNATSIQYTYQGQKLTQVVDNSVSPSETHTFTYDDRFRVATNTQATRGTLTYTYDGADRTASYELSGGTSANYAYYPDGSLSTITWSPVAGTFKYTYNARGQYQSITLPNGASRTFSYDDQGRLTQLANTHPTAGNLATFAYGYDNVRLGQRTSMTADFPALGWTGAQTTYAYDATYQLTGATYPNVMPFAGEVDGWTYDGIGNRTSATVNGTTTSYAYQKIGTNPLNWQRLVTAGATSFTYDSNGNTATITGNTFGYDYENRMNSITGNVTASYKYDYQGRRTSKGATTYGYDGLNLIHESGTITNDYLFGPGIDEPLAVASGGLVSYYTVDGLGSVAALTDASGAAQNTYAYDAWGVPRSSTATVPQPFTYTARESGDVASQWFYRARYYQSDVGRFLSEEPDGWSGDRYNAYRVVFNNPLFYVDPDGRTPVAATTIAGGAVGGPVGAVIGVAVGLAITYVILDNAGAVWKQIMNPATPTPASQMGKGGPSGSNDTLDRARAEAQRRHVDVCQVLAEWLAAAKCRGDQKEIAEIRKAQKYAGCRHSSYS